jgi:hypothetical protein
MVVQKRLGRVETTRYLVMDLKSGLLCIYRDPPPGIAAQQKRPKSAASRMKASMNSLVKSNNLSRVTELEDGHLALAHINRERRPSPKQRRQSKIQEMRHDSWEPKIVVPPHVDWKIR